MKKIIVLCLLLVLSVNTFAQLGYWFDSKFIPLEKKESSEYRYIQTRTVESQKALGNLYEQTVPKKDRSIVKLNEDRFLVKKNIRIDETGIYESDLYTSPENERIMVLPRIIVSLLDGYSIDPVLEILSGKAVVESSKDRRYVLSCEMKTSTEVLEAISAISHLDGIKYFEPEMYFKCHADNTYYSLQYYLNNTATNGVDINVVPAWNITTGKSTVTVAVLDEGVERNHEDLVNRVLNGYTIRNSTGYGEPQNADETNPKAHGTACAGIIAASNNSIGIRGVASGVKILPVNIAPDYEDDYEFGTGIEIADAIRWAYPRADVISCACSLMASNDILSAVNDALSLGRGGKGCVFIASAGNLGGLTSDVAYPARYNGVLAVGAVRSNGTIWDYSQYGPSMGVVAPSGLPYGAGNVVTTDWMSPNGFNTSSNYTQTFGGTSASCSQVAGVAALMLSVNSSLTAPQVKSKLQSTATDLGTTGFDSYYGYGLVNAYAAVVSAISKKISGPSLISSSATYSIADLPSTLSVTWSLTDSYYNSHCLQQNTPSVNKCTITRNASHDMSGATLIASIKLNGSVIATVSKSNLHAYAGFKGTYYNGQSTVQVNLPSPLSVSTGTLVTITSPNLIGATASQSGGNLSPTYWQLNNTSGVLKVGMPSSPSGAIVVRVNCPDGNVYSLPIVQTNSSSLQMSMSLEDGVLRVSVNTQEYIEELRSYGVEADATEMPWKLEVRNALTGEIVYENKFSESTCAIETAGWKPGIYVVSVIMGDKVMSEKIAVK